jgi:hypothetical protein
LLAPPWAGWLWHIELGGAYSAGEEIPMFDMRRREVITLLGAAAAAWPVAARAQQPNLIRRIGVLNPLAEDDPEAQANITAFRQTLQKLGWTPYRSVFYGGLSLGPASMSYPHFGGNKPSCHPINTAIFGTKRA